MSNLKIFDQNGHQFNFNKKDLGNDDLAWVGDIYFDTNSSDTYKSIGFYILEEIDATETSGNYYINRLQIHNNRFEFKNAKGSLTVSNNANDANYCYISATIPDVNWYTKWIYSANIGLKFPQGSWIYFESTTDDLNSGFIHPNPTGNSTLYNENFWITLDLMGYERLDQYNFPQSPINYTDPIDCYNIKLFRVLVAEKDRILIDTRYKYEYNKTQNGWQLNNYIGTANRDANNIWSKIESNDWILYKIKFGGIIKSINTISVASNATTGQPDKIWSCENWFKSKCIQVKGSSYNDKCYNIIDTSKPSWQKYTQFYIYSDKPNNLSFWKIYLNALELETQTGNKTTINFILKLKLDEVKIFNWTYTVGAFWQMIKDFTTWLDTLTSFGFYYKQDIDNIFLWYPIEMDTEILTQYDWILDWAGQNEQNYTGGLPKNFDFSNTNQKLYSRVINYLYSYSYLTVNNIISDTFLIPIEETDFNKNGNFGNVSIITLPVEQTLIPELNTNYNTNYTIDNPYIIQFININKLSITINGITYEQPFISIDAPSWEPSANTAHMIMNWIAQYEETLEQYGIRVKAEIIKDSVFPYDNMDINSEHEYQEYPGTWVGAKTNNYYIIENGIPVKREPILLETGTVLLHIWPIVEDLIIDIDVNVGTGKYRIKVADIYIDKISDRFSMGFYNASGALTTYTQDLIIDNLGIDNEWLWAGWTINNWIRTNTTVEYPAFPTSETNKIIFTVTGSGPWVLNITSGVYIFNGLSHIIAPINIIIPTTPLYDRIDILEGDAFNNINLIVGTASGTPLEPVVNNKPLLRIRVKSDNTTPVVEAIIVQDDNYIAKKTIAANQLWYPTDWNLFSYTINNIGVRNLITTGTYIDDNLTVRQLNTDIIIPDPDLLLRYDVLCANSINPTTYQYITGIASGSPTIPVIPVGYTTVLVLTIPTSGPIIINKTNFTGSAYIQGPWSITTTIKWVFGNVINQSTDTFILNQPENTTRIDYLCVNNNAVNINTTDRKIVAIETYSTGQPFAYMIQPKEKSPWITPFISGALESEGVWFKHRWIEPYTSTISLPNRSLGKNILEIWAEDQKNIAFELNLNTDSVYKIINNNANIGCFVTGNQIDSVNIDPELYSEFHLNFNDMTKMQSDLKFEFGGIKETGTVFSEQHLIQSDADLFIPKINVNIIPSVNLQGTVFKARFNKTLIEPISWTLIDNGVWRVSRKIEYVMSIDLSGGFNNGDTVLSSLIIQNNTWSSVTFVQIMEDVDFVDTDAKIPASFLEDTVFIVKRSFYSTDPFCYTSVKIEGVIKFKHNDDTDWQLDLPQIFYDVQSINSITESELTTGSEIQLSGSYYNTNNIKYLVTNLLDTFDEAGQLNGSKIVINYTGPIIPDFNNIKLQTEKTYRYPRKRFSYEPQHKLRFRWDAVEDDNDTIFLYDFTGKNLKTENNITYGEIDGEIDPDYYPLWQPSFDCSTVPEVYLNSVPNTDPGKALIPKYQQVRFEQLEFPIYPLDWVELADYNSCCTSITPLQAFVGFNNPEEGVTNRTLIIEEVLDLTIIFTRKKTNDTYFYDILVNNKTILNYQIDNLKSSNLDTEFIESRINALTRSYNQIGTINGLTQPLYGQKYNIEFKSTGEITVNAYFLNFIDLGFVPGMYLKITGKDITNIKYKSNVNSHGAVGKIKTVSDKTITLENANLFNELNEFWTKTTWNPNINPVDSPNVIPPIGDWNLSLTWIEITLEVLPKIISQIKLWGETETEDERYKIWLDNFGIKLNQQDIQIFEEYDIEEKGIDWTFYNKKRKEMMLIHQSIYSYIGSYRAIINSINFFGWETLKLYEYYRNIDKKSPLFNKLHGIEIKKIFDSTTLGWEQSKFQYPNAFYKKTDLLNLTYEYTDREGNFISDQNLNNIVIKLQKLKYWLRNNVLPLTARILDISVKGYYPTTYTVQHSNTRLIKNRSTDNNITNIDVIPSAYVLGIGQQTALNIHLEFYNADSNEKTDLKSPFNLRINTYRQYSDAEINSIKSAELNHRMCEWFKYLDYKSLTNNLQIPNTSLEFTNVISNGTIEIDGVSYNMVDFNTAPSSIKITNTYINDILNPLIMEYSDLDKRVSDTCDNLFLNGITFPLTNEIKIYTTTNGGANTIIAIPPNNTDDPIYGTLNINKIIIYKQTAYIFNSINNNLFNSMLLIITSWKNWYNNMVNYIIDKRVTTNIILEGNYLANLKDSLINVQLISEYKTDLMSYNFLVNRNVDPYFEVIIETHEGRGAGLNLKRSYQVRVEGTENDNCQCVDFKINKWVNTNTGLESQIIIPILYVKPIACDKNFANGSIFIDLITSSDNIPFNIDITKRGAAFINTNIITANLITSYPTDLTPIANTFITSINNQTINLTRYLNDYQLEIAGLPGGLYDITYTDSNGIKGFKTIAIKNPSDIIINYSISHPLCFNDTGRIEIISILNACADYTLQWQQLIGNVWTNIPYNELLLIIVEGTYRVIIDYCDGCTYTSDSYILVNPPELIATEYVIDPTGCYGSTGTLGVNIAGGTLPYDITVQYSNWPISFAIPIVNFNSAELAATDTINLYESQLVDGINSNSIMDIYSGDYIISITDNNGCNKTLAFTINDIFNISLDEFDIINPLCPGNLGSFGLINFGNVLGNIIVRLYETNNITPLGELIILKGTPLSNYNLPTDLTPSLTGLSVGTYLIEIELFTFIGSYIIGELAYANGAYYECINPTSDMPSNLSADWQLYSTCINNKFYLGNTTFSIESPPALVGQFVINSYNGSIVNFDIILSGANIPYSMVEFLIQPITSTYVEVPLCPTVVELDILMGTTYGNDETCYTIIGNNTIISNLNFPPNQFISIRITDSEGCVLLFEEALPSDLEIIEIIS